MSLPKGWIKTELQSIGKIVTGKTPSKKNTDFYGGNCLLVKPGDLDKKIFVTNTEDKLTELGLDDAPAIPSGSVMVTCIGNMGKVGIASQKLATNQQINSIVPYGDIVDSKYLYFYTKTLKPWLEQESSATTISIINKSKFSTAPILLAPLNEQKRIAKKLDELFATVESIKTRLDNAPYIIKRFRQSILAAATSGKLTEEWREENGVTKWKYTALKDVTTKVGAGSTPRGGKSAYKESGISLVRSMNVHFKGIKYKNMAFIDDDQAKKLSNATIQEEDVLLNITGASIGRVTLAPSDLEGARVNQHVSIIRTKKDELLPQYLNLYLASPVTQKWIQSENYGGTREALTKIMILNYEVPKPCIEEQKEIVSQVESLFTLADTLEAKIEAAKKRVDRLSQSILVKAFSGELVPQDPSDEPAEKILERIKAGQEKEKLKKTRKIQRI